MTAYSFMKWLNNEYLKENPDKLWIKEVSTISVQKTTQNIHNLRERTSKMSKCIFVDKVKMILSSVNVIELKSLLLVGLN